MGVNEDEEEQWGKSPPREPVRQTHCVILIIRYGDDANNKRSKKTTARRR